MSLTAKENMLHYADTHNTPGVKVRAKARTVSCWRCASQWPADESDACPACGWTHPHLA